MQLPAGFHLACVAIGPSDDRHVAGRIAAERALAPLGGTLGYDGTRPIVLGAEAAVSITHGRTRAYAIAARVRRIGIDLVDDADGDRLAELAPRYLGAEQKIATTAHTRAACFAAKEAGLKALGLGLLEGGMFDDCAVRVVGLVPPRLVVDGANELALVIERLDDGTLAVAYAA